MRKRCLDTVYELAKRDPNIVFIGSDLGAGTLDKFKAEMPERFFMEGISEQHIIGMAAGLAMAGKEVYVNTIATFLTRRCYEQIFVDLALTKAKVRLIGSGGGLVYAPLGPTHTGIEDIALMRAIPNMTVLVPADAEEMDVLVRQCSTVNGPVYIRVAKGGDPIVMKNPGEVRIGKAILYREGSDAMLISTGALTNTALSLSDSLAEQGVSAGVLHFNTLTPFDIEGLLAAVEPVNAVFTLEEHIANGGLGAGVASVLMENLRNKPVIFKIFSLGNDFVEGYGAQEGQLARAGLSVGALQQSILAAMA